MLGGELPHTRVGTGVPPPSAPGVASQQRPPGATSAASTCRLRGKSGVLPPSLPVSSSASPSLAACTGAQAHSREAAARRSRHRRRWLRNPHATTARPPPRRSACRRLCRPLRLGSVPGERATAPRAATPGPSRRKRRGRATFVRRVNAAVRGLGVVLSVFPTATHSMPETTPRARAGAAPTFRAREPRLGVGPPTGVSGKGRSRDWAGAAAAAPGRAAGGRRPVGRTRVLGAGSRLPSGRRGRARPVSPRPGPSFPLDDPTPGPALFRPG